jgi:two-component system KDP operon response regulator KdpE
MGRLSVNFASREVRVEGNVVHLTPIEFKLLRIFTRYPNPILAHSILIREIWGTEGNGNYVPSLRVYVGHLRRKLAGGAETWASLQTKAGIGYHFQTD